jgi:hypothetical protein
MHDTLSTIIAFTVTTVIVSALLWIASGGPLLWLAAHLILNGGRF